MSPTRVSAPLARQPFVLSTSTCPTPSRRGPPEQITSSAFTCARMMLLSPACASVHFITSRLPVDVHGVRAVVHHVRKHRVGLAADGGAHLVNEPADRQPGSQPGGQAAHRMSRKKPLRPVPRPQQRAGPEGDQGLMPSNQPALHPPHHQHAPTPPSTAANVPGQAPTRLASLALPCLASPRPTPPGHQLCPPPPCTPLVRTHRTQLE
mgnify:CR=1 FL=1